MRYDRVKTSTGDWARYDWDELSRLVTSYDGPRTHYSVYEYRPDGLRSHRAVSYPSGPNLHEALRYDGQMSFELERYSDDTHATTSVRFGLGARGIDCEQSATGTHLCCLSTGSKKRGLAVTDVKVKVLSGSKA